MPLPPEALENVLSRIFTDMEALGWDGLTDDAKTKQYNTWVDDPDVGGVIEHFNDDPRHWIKDGPVKEWPRARMGIGAYAKYLPVRDGQIDQVVQLALGDCWTPDMTTIKTKPLRVTANHRSDTHEPVVVAWAPAKDLKHLVWAALNAEAKGDGREWVLVVRATFERPTPADQRVHNERIAHRCQLSLRHIEVD